ncbi:hypothetical protein A2Z67_04695 [Candidatus Woesebacteria bacterium RBG_13_36_22]|uniref:Methyltransferase n=1 Tax=Candidatus Woesebacteria bacterium RBG_13_36_22 TaxID=1802478 RepID=A0A1F7X294_9BACT|nr:MAG: hypothetical protein A2Z67_04695 [Candidatus Woesebacteria bacterium RBG_13_36_22]
MIFETDVWRNCYETGWKDSIVSDAFCHPAKFSCALVEKIYNHAVDNEWLKKGNIVLDPFGGVALGGFGAMTRGAHWIGIEIEKKFVELGRKNIKKWEGLDKELCESRPFHLYRGTAKIIQGDSRKLKELIDKADLVMSSPPYANSLSGSDKPENHARRQELATKAGHGRIGCGQLRYQNAYGCTPGNLSNMKADLIMSSPPYGASEICSSKQADREQRKIDRKNKTWEGYNKDNKDNLGSIAGDDFWLASREIIQECYNLLKPDGHAIWVTKDYIRNKTRINFSDTWASLCESVGFKIVCWHYAMLVNNDPQTAFDGAEFTKERKSFFRRLQEKKGAPRIDWEDVVCMVK